MLLRLSTIEGFRLVSLPDINQIAKRKREKQGSSPVGKSGVFLFDPLLTKLIPRPSGE